MAPGKSAHPDEEVAGLPVDPAPPPPPTNVDSIIALCENRKVRGLCTRRALARELAANCSYAECHRACALAV